MWETPEWIETLWAFECPTDDNQFYLSLPSFWYLCGDDYEDAVIGYSSLRVSKALINLMEDKDIRKTQFPKDSETNDYISETGYLTTKIHSRNNEMGQGSFNMLRGSEMYLIIAELAADKQHYDVAKEALNVVRIARGLDKYSGTDAGLADEIQQERRRELFAEGHRLFDMKRRGLALTRTGVDGHDLWTSQLDLPAGSDRFELPIPQAEIEHNLPATDVSCVETYLYDASYLRLKNIEIGYNLPQKWLSTLNITGLRVYVNATNLLTFTSVPQIDPENIHSQGWSYPQMKAFNFGLTLQF